jgi:lipopolysaccharide/colanic/teichoic acid biosynthesis glycosyltransferase
MVAIVIATGQNPAFHGLDEYMPVPLLPLADRPFLQHVVEALVRHGARRFEFVLCHLPEKIEARFGDGARWGCSFRYHLTPSDSEALRVAAGIASGESEEILLASGTSLPAFDLTAVAPGALIYYADAWTGWARIAPGARLPTLPIPAGTSAHIAGICLSINTGDDFLRAQRAALDGTFEGLMIAGREADPHVWISRNVALHPSVVIAPPVYIGENCRIGKGAQIGPSAVIGSNCIIDEQSIVLNSMVAPGTYIGEALELDSVVVDRNRLVNLRLGTSVLISETFLLGSLTERSRGRAVQRLRDRLIALVLLLILWPLLLAVFLYAKIKGGGFTSRETVDIPADDNPVSWHMARVLRYHTGGQRPGCDFLFTFLPGLVSVLLGNVFLVGVQPRSREEIESLTPDWRSLYLKSKAGLITEARVMFGPDGTEDEIYTGEAFYSATESGLHDLKLAGLWLRGLFARPAAPATLVDDLDS